MKSFLISAVEASFFCFKPGCSLPKHTKTAVLSTLARLAMLARLAAGESMPRGSSSNAVATLTSGRKLVFLVIRVRKELIPPV